MCVFVLCALHAHTRFARMWVCRTYLHAHSLRSCFACLLDARVTRVWVDQLWGMQSRNFVQGVCALGSFFNSKQCE